MDNKNEFKPFISADSIVPEFTVTSIILGLILAIVFGAANAYLGLRVGMTVSASIPIALSRAKQRGLVHSGMKVMLLGFGVGYSWGGCILEI